MKIRTSVRAGRGGWDANHNEVLVRASPSNRKSRRRSKVRKHGQR